LSPDAECFVGPFPPGTCRARKRDPCPWSESAEESRRYELKDLRAALSFLRPPACGFSCCRNSICGANNAKSPGRSGQVTARLGMGGGRWGGVEGALVVAREREGEGNRVGGGAGVVLGGGWWCGSRVWVGCCWTREGEGKFSGWERPSGRCWHLGEIGGLQRGKRAHGGVWLVGPPPRPFSSRTARHQCFVVFRSLSVFVAPATGGRAGGVAGITSALAR